MASGLKIAAISLFLICSLLGAWPAETARAVERVVVLAPAAADILKRLEAGDSVVGVTNNVADFPDAVKVGTHLSPGIEKIASLRPSLIIAAGRFDPALAERMGAALFVYEPKTLDGLLADVRNLAALLGREDAGRRLAAELQAVLDGLAAPGGNGPQSGTAGSIGGSTGGPDARPTVLYETRSNPLAVAASGSIIKDVLERAGFRYLYPGSGGAISAEYLLAGQPDYYIYQVGPMNKNPLPPLERPGWSGFGACVWRVDEFDFARPNTRLFETVRELNRLLHAENPCAEGQMVFGE